MVTGQGGALRRGPLRAGARLAHLAWAVRPLSGLRRMVFLAVLCGALLAGAVPFTARPALLVGLWLPAFCYTSLGLALLSGWTLRPGDRARWSLHTLGPALSSLGGPHAVTAPRQAVLASPAAPYGAGLTLAVVALSVVLVLRALSERVTHTLGELSQEHLMGLLVVSLWTLALSLDLLRVLARRAQLRRSPRVVAAMPASLGDRAVSVVDVTPLGAGVLSTMPVAVGEHIVLATSISTRTGVTDVTIPCVVRNAVPRGAGEYRIGVEFGPLEGSAADALAEFCSIEPMWERMGALPGRSITEAREIIYLPEPEPLGPGKAAVRIAALVAVAGAVGSSIPGTVEAAGATTHRLAGVVVEAVAPTDPAPTDPVPIDTGVPSDSLVDTDEPISSPDTTEAAVVESAVPVGVPGAIVVVVCAEAPGNDGVWGTADDVYGTPLTVETDADGTYSVDITGEACWATVAPPVGFEPVDPEVAVDLAPIDLSPSSGPVPTVVEVRRVAAPSPARGALGDRVWLDSNRNGLQDPDEDGVAGVQLTLLDPDLRVVARAVSTADGTFQFDGLTDGEYVLVASDLPDGLAFAPDAAGDDGTDSDVHPVTGRSAPVEIVAGRRWDNVDVGVTPLPADTATAPATPATPASADPERVLPEPAASDLAPTPKADSAPLAAVVLALAALLAGSILLGLVSPLVASRRRSRHVSGPALRRPPE
ncbi:MAG TPA: hypothetical protein DCR14_03840 [Acidimicrobiaceae bacterium]|nr:hypothetical protein [Acidimicrobiaceae bacterium]